MYMLICLHLAKFNNCGNFLFRQSIHLMRWVVYTNVPFKTNYLSQYSSEVNARQVVGRTGEHWPFCSLFKRDTLSVVVLTLVLRVFQKPCRCRRRKNQRMTQVKMFIHFRLTQHVSGIIMPIIRRQTGVCC